MALIADPYLAKDAQLGEHVFGVFLIDLTIETSGSVGYVL